MDKQIIKNRLIDFEAMVLQPYKCSSGFLSLGVGRNLDANGISEEEALYLLSNDIDAVIDTLDRHWKVWRSFPTPAQYVCIDLVFNMGINAWMSFRKTRAYMELGKWEEASKELLNSKYASQVGRRALFNSEELAKCQNQANNTKAIPD
jgi:lysozyme